MNNLMTADRKPFDHFVSGTLIGAFTFGAIGYKDVLDGKTNAKDAAKKSIKFALIGGIATGAGIHASNCLVRRNYINFALTSALAIGSIIAVENIIKIQEK